VEFPNAQASSPQRNGKENNRRKLARLITQYRNIFSNISEGTAFLIQGVTENDSSLKRYIFFKYGKYDMTSEKIINNKRLMNRAIKVISNGEKS